jgi:hypothetical protein
MPTRRQTGTNAADSAPGVDDGRTNAATHSKSAQPNKPIGWILVALSLLALLAIFIMKPAGTDNEGGAAVGPAATQGEIQNSTVPGADNRNPAAQNR